MCVPRLRLVTAPIYAVFVYSLKTSLVRLLGLVYYKQDAFGCVLTVYLELNLLIRRADVHNQC